MAWLTCWRDSKKETGLCECTWRQRHKPTSAVWSKAHRHAHTQPVSWESTTRIVLLLVLQQKKNSLQCQQSGMKAGVLPEWPLTLERAKCIPTMIKSKWTASHKRRPFCRDYTSCCHFLFSSRLQIKQKPHTEEKCTGVQGHVIQNQR